MPVGIAAVIFALSGLFRAAPEGAPIVSGTYPYVPTGGLIVLVQRDSYANRMALQLPTNLDDETMNQSMAAEFRVAPQTFHADKLDAFLDRSGFDAAFHEPAALMLTDPEAWGALNAKARTDSVLEKTMVDAARLQVIGNAMGKAELSEVYTSFLPLPAHDTWIVHEVDAGGSVRIEGLLPGLYVAEAGVKFPPGEGIGRYEILGSHRVVFRIRPEETIDIRLYVKSEP